MMSALVRATRFTAGPSAATAAVRRTLSTAAVAPPAVPTAAASSTIVRPVAPFLFVGAPLEDVSESAFRRLLYRGGADLAYTEMARVENLARKAKQRAGTSWHKTHHALPGSGAAQVQLLCGNEESLRQVLEAFEPCVDTFAGFNLNLGCPSPQILALGLGAQAIKRIAKTQRYVEQLNEFLARKCTSAEWTARTLPPPTVSIKLRLGANEREKRLGSHTNLIKALNGNTTSSASASTDAPTSTSSASSGPVSHFILHGRHGKQHYEAKCDLSAIAATISSTGARNIIANGDVHTLEQVLQCVEMGAAGVMIGRASVKDPWIFSRLKNALLAARPDVQLANAPTPEMRSIEFRDAYLDYAAEYGTLEKYMSNVSGRIGQPFEPNPRVVLNERARVEMQGRQHPQYAEAVERDRARMRYAPKPYDKVRVNYKQAMEEQLQDNVQG